MKQTNKQTQVCYLGDENPRIIAIMGGGFGASCLHHLPVLDPRSQSPMVITLVVLRPRVDIQLASVYWRLIRIKIK